MELELPVDLDAENRIAIELVVRRRVFQLNFAEIGVELFGENHRDRRIDALPHLDLRHDQSGLAGVIDANKSVRREFAVGRIGRLLRLVRGAHRKVEGQGEPRRQSAFEQNAARRHMRNIF